LGRIFFFDLSPPNATSGKCQRPTAIGNKSAPLKQKCLARIENEKDPDTPYTLLKTLDLICIAGKLKRQGEGKKPSRK
jgi:hypothetical protein